MSKYTEAIADLEHHIKYAKEIETDYIGDSTVKVDILETSLEALQIADSLTAKKIYVNVTYDSLWAIYEDVARRLLEVDI